MKKIAFYTLGCKVNQADSASMESLFREAGYQVVGFTEPADIFVINTCVVTNTGQRKSRQSINRAIRRNPGAVVAVTGCYPQTAEEEVRAIEGVDLIIGNQDRHNIVQLVEEAMEQSRVDTLSSVHRLEANTAFEEMNGGNEADKTRAYLKIQEGCNQFCSYCIIPYARGPIRSRSLESITAEVGRLVGLGYKEVVLIGIHLGCYGKELKNGTTLYDAVEAALRVKELERLRLGSLESVEVEDRLLDLMAADSRLCPHLHLPLQSGCDKILTTMHRPYDTARFTALLGSIRKRLPQVAITTDVIVGFPGETEENFQATCEYVRSCNFAKMHIFPYSVRKGTPAADFANQLTEAVKAQRAGALAAIDEQLQLKYHQSCVGQTVRVLVEQTAELAKEEALWDSREGYRPLEAAAPAATEAELKGYVEGLAENYVRVFLKGAPELCGRVVQVRIVRALADKVIGEPV